MNHALLNGEEAKAGFERILQEHSPTKDMEAMFE